MDAATTIEPPFGWVMTRWGQEVPRLPEALSDAWHEADRELIAAQGQSYLNGSFLDTPRYHAAHQRMQEVESALAAWLAPYPRWRCKDIVAPAYTQAS